MTPDERYPCPMLRCGWYLTAHDISDGCPRAGMTRAAIAAQIVAHLQAVHIRDGDR